MKNKFEEVMDEKRNVVFDHIWDQNFDFKVLIESFHKLKERPEIR